MRDTTGMPDSPSEDRCARQRFVADPAVLRELQLDLEQLADEDVRATVIRAEHPELEEALKAGLDESDGPAGPMNPRVHLLMQEIVATQLWTDTPPQMWATARRLRDQGYERHEVLHMLGRVVSTQIWRSMRGEGPVDHDAQIAALNELPESWERERAAIRLEREHEGTRQRNVDDARRRARRQSKSSRRRNRRR